MIFSIALLMSAARGAAAGTQMALGGLQVAAEALIATEQDLRVKIRGLDDEIDNKRDLLGDLVKRHDGGAAELAGADANLASAGDLRPDCWASTWPPAWSAASPGSAWMSCGMSD